MANFFDQFDEAPKTGNFFDQFDARSAEPTRKSTIGSELVRGGKQLASSVRTGASSLFGSPEEASIAGVERSQAIAEEAGEGASLAAVKEAYRERGLLSAAGEVLTQLPRALAGQGAQLATMAGGAKLGAMAGTAVAPGPGTLIGGALGAGATLLPQFFGSNIERQASEQLARDEEVNIDRTKAGAAAAGQTVIETAGTAFVLGKRLVKGVLGITDDAALMTAQAQKKMVQAAERSLLAASGRGAVVGAAVEIPVEIASSVLERAQAGLDVMSPEALAEYGEAAYQAALVGGSLGTVGGVTNTSFARQGVKAKTAADEAEAKRIADAEQARLDAEAARKVAAPPSELESEVPPADLIDPPPSPPIAPKPIPGDLFEAPPAVTTVGEPPLAPIEPAAKTPKPQAAKITGWSDDYSENLPAEAGSFFQNRDRSAPASVGQMQSIAANPDYSRLSVNRDFGSGAPVVISDLPISEDQFGKIAYATASDGTRIPVRYAVVEGNDITPSNTSDGTKNSEYGDLSVTAIRPIAGNGRVAGLRAAYSQGTAENYKRELLEDTEHGINPDIIGGFQNPVLVRVMPKSRVTANIADISNISGTLRLSPVEAAKNDIGRVNLGGLTFNDDGSPNTNTLIQFVRSMPKDEQGELIDAKGMPNTKAIDRLNNAIFYKAYGSDTLIELYAQAADQEAKAVLNALAKAAPKMAALDGAGEFDVRASVLDAAEMAVNARRAGQKLKDYVQQGMLGADPYAIKVLEMFADNSRSSKRMAEALDRLATLAGEQTSKSGSDMFGDVPKMPKDDLYKALVLEPDVDPDLFAPPAESDAAKIKREQDARLEQERLEKERLERERLEKERLEKNRLEKERLEKERLEKARQEKQRLENERLINERLERERIAEEERVAEEERKAQSLVINTPEERKAAIAQLQRALNNTVPNFNSRGADGRVTPYKPTALSRILQVEILKLSNMLLDLGMPVAVLRYIKSAGSSRAQAIAAMVGDQGWLLIEGKWKNQNDDVKLGSLVHELGHAVDGGTYTISNSPKWDTAHNELKYWYGSSKNKLGHPLNYPFNPLFKNKVRIKAETLAQAFRYYFTSPDALRANAPEAYSQIQAIVEGIANEQQRTRPASPATAKTSGNNVQPARDTAVGKDQSRTGAVVPAVSTTERVGDRGAEEVTQAPATDSAAFRRFFGDSKVVDENGEPLVMYHGTSQNQKGEAFTFFDTYGSSYGLMGMGAYFTDNSEVASSYTTKGKGDTPTVYPVFLSIKNPLDMDAEADADAWTSQFDDIDQYHDGGTTNESWYRAAEELLTDQQMPLYEGAEIMQDGIRAMGFDGITHIGGGRIKSDGVKHRVFIAFEPTQIKSATGNIGTFDPEVQDIRYQLEAPPEADAEPARVSPTRQNIFGDPVLGTWSITVDPKMELQDGLIYKLLDKNIDIKRILQEVKKTGKEIAARFNPYLQEELYHGRTANAALEFADKERVPFIEDMQKKNVTVGELEKYLLNRHAEDYNKVVAKRNPTRPEMQDGGSNVTTAAARKYLADLDEGTKAKYEALAKRIDSITKGTRQLLVDTGYEKAKTIEGWEKAFPNYVPLMREEMDFDYNFGSFGTGRGFDVRRDFSRSAMGSKRNVVDIIGNVFAARNNAIALTEKNRVAQAVYGLALDAPNPDFWMAINPEAEKLPQDAIDELRSLGLDDEAVKFLMKEPKQRMLDPKKNEVFSRVNDVLRKGKFVLATRINGEKRYVFFNPKDPRSARAATALKNLDAQDLGTTLGLISKATRWMASVNTQYNPIFGPYNFLRDFQAGALQLSTTELAGQQKEIAKLIVPSMGAIYSSLRKRRKGETSDFKMTPDWKEYQKEGGQTGFRDNFSRTQDRTEALLDEMARLTEGKLKSGTRAVFDWLSDYNDSLENAVRLSAYVVARDKFIKEGMSPAEAKQRAASLAKNLTVNFNRKGDVATQMGALYAFFNASMQGSARMIETLKGPMGRKIVGGGLLLGSMQALLLASAGFDDEEPREFIRSKNIVIPTGDGNYFAFPMPLGFHVIPGISRILTEWAMSGFDDTARRVTDLTGLFLDAFNPVGNAGWSVQTLAPTVLDPFVALGENKDFTGKPISKEDMFSLNPTPGYSRAREGANFLTTAFAEFLNASSGGDKDRPGVISPTPEQIEYLIGQATGGVGREFVKLTTTINKTITGEDLPPYKIPLYGRFFGETKSSAAESNKFYKNMKELNQLNNVVTGRRERREPLGDFFKENPEARLLPLANKTFKDVQELRKRRKALLERDAPKASIEAVEKLITRRMAVLNERVKALEGN